MWRSMGMGERPYLFSPFEYLGAGQGQPRSALPGKEAPVPQQPRPLRGSLSRPQPCPHKPRRLRGEPSVVTAPEGMP